MKERQEGPTRSAASAYAATPMPPTPSPLAHRKATYIHSEGAVLASRLDRPHSRAPATSSRRRPAGGLVGGKAAGRAQSEKECTIGS